MAGALALLVGLTLAPAGAQAASKHPSALIPAGTGSTLELGGSAEALGDVNGDGLDDFAVTLTNGPSTRRRTDVRVVYGSRSHTYPTGLDALGTGGFTIRGTNETATVQAARDVDSDGFNDILVYYTGGNAVVLYGAATNADIVIGGTGGDGPRVTQLPTKTAFESIGDFDGDGYDDLVAVNSAPDGVVVLGGPRAQSIDATGARTMLVTGLRHCDPVDWTKLLLGLPAGGGCKIRVDKPTPVGDVDGDGFTDLVLTQEEFYDYGNKVWKPARNWVMFGRPGAGSTRVNPRTANPGFAAMTQPAGPGLLVDQPWRDAPGHDVDGDGRSDLAIIRQDTVSTWRPDGYVKVEGQGPIEVSNATVGSLDGFDIDGEYDEHVASSPDPANLKVAEAIGDLDGDGSLDGQARWAAYAADMPESVDPAYPRSALVLFGSDTDEFAPIMRPRVPGLTAGPGVVPRAFRPEAPRTVGAGASSYEPAVSLDYVWRREGSSDALGTGPLFSGIVGGQPLPAGRYEVAVSATDEAGNRSASQILPFELLPQGDGPSDSGLLEPLSGAWRTNGAARKLPDGSVELTPASPTVHGEVYWPTQINRTALGPGTISTIEFDVEMTGGSPPGGGMTVGFTDAVPGSGVTPGTGSSLGFAPRGGQAFALQTYKAARTDPGTNFVGFTDRAIPNSRPVALQWIGTANLLVPLRGAPVHVKVQMSTILQQAWINGAFVLQTVGRSTSSRYLQFTASTGPGQNQRHVVRNVRYTQQWGEG